VGQSARSSICVLWNYTLIGRYFQDHSRDCATQAIFFAWSRIYSIIGEVKSRDVKKFSKEELMEFEKKFTGVKKLENIDRAVGFIFSRSGFTKDAEAYCQEKGIACSEDERWLAG
jgi:hypothetical protein